MLISLNKSKKHFRKFPHRRSQFSSYHKKWIFLASWHGNANEEVHYGWVPGTQMNPKQIMNTIMCISLTFVSIKRYEFLVNLFHFRRCQNRCSVGCAHRSKPEQKSLSHAWNRHFRHSLDGKGADTRKSWIERGLRVRENVERSLTTMLHAKCANGIWQVALCLPLSLVNAETTMHRKHSRLTGLSSIHFLQIET